MYAEVFISCLDQCLSKGATWWYADGHLVVLEEVQEIFFKFKFINFNCSFTR